MQPPNARFPDFAFLPNARFPDFAFLRKDPIYKQYKSAKMQSQCGFFRFSLALFLIFEYALFCVKRCPAGIFEK